MGFMEAYKYLEKLCGEILGDERRISAYIEELESLPLGAKLVAGWNDDLKNLKHYRWIRNQIVHDPSCTEEIMCDEQDTRWIEDFHSRIMNQTDPLTRYRRAVQRRSVSTNSQKVTQTYTVQPDTHKRTAKIVVVAVFALVCALLAIVAVLIGFPY